MQQFKYLCFAIALLFPGVVHAGQIYGSVISGGEGVSNASIEIACEGRVAATGATAADGSYRINVEPQGQCDLALPTYKGASAAIFSGPNPSAYNFELVQRPGGDWELRRR